MKEKIPQGRGGGGVRGGLRVLFCIYWKSKIFMDQI